MLRLFLSKLIVLIVAASIFYFDDLEAPTEAPAYFSVGYYNGAWTKVSWSKNSGGSWIGTGDESVSFDEDYEEKKKSMYVKLQTNSTKGYSVFFTSKNKTEVGDYSNTSTLNATKGSAKLTYSISLQNDATTSGDILLKTSNPELYADGTESPLNYPIKQGNIDPRRLPVDNSVDSTEVVIILGDYSGLPPGTYKDTITVHAAPN